MATGQLPLITPEQYFAIEREREFKSEYIDGAMYAMSGGGAAHSRLGVRIVSALEVRLARQDCAVFNSDMEVGLGENGPFFYPDASVTCAEAIFVEGRPDVLANPLLIVEVLSPSTEGYDRGKKFGFYRKIQSLREYVLVSQSEPRIETFTRDKQGAWTQFSVFEGDDGVCRLRSLDCEIPLIEIYAGIVLHP